jgi:hypothetical protein
MIAETRAFSTAKLVLAIAVACTAVSVSPALAAAAAGTPISYEKESLAEYEQQLAGSQIASVAINKRLRSLRITLKDGRYVLAKYNKKELPKVEGALAAKHVSVSVLTPSQALGEVKAKPVHHKLRYIAGGGLIAVIVIVGTVLFVYRRRRAEE